MPVSFSVATHSAEAFQFDPQEHDGFNGEHILARAAMDPYRKSAKMLQFGLTGMEVSGCDFATKFTDIVPSNNGFFHTVLTAYNKHHALVIRPDDVWLAVLCQFNFFINTNAEVLRASFVENEGKQELEVKSDLPLDFASMSRQMANVIDTNVADPTLRAWALPAFTTTTVNDTTVAAVLLMATLKNYFFYGFSNTACGIPRVTLEGEKADWLDILGRLEKLKEYGVEAIAWYHLLRPAIARFVVAFDAPNSEENIDFWSKIVHHHRGSGYSYYSGWINAFNVFSKQGKWQGHALDTAFKNSLKWSILNE